MPAMPPGCTLRRYGLVAACCRFLVQVRQLEGVVSSRQHDLLKNALQCCPDTVECFRLLGPKGPLHFGHKLINHGRSGAILQGLDGVEEPQVENVRVRAVGRLVDELHPSLSLPGRRHDVRVCHHTVPRSVVLLREDGRNGRKLRHDVWKDIVDELLLVRCAVDLHTVRHHRPRCPVPAVALRSTLLSEGVYTDFAIELVVAARVEARPSNCCEEHDLGHVAFVLDLPNGKILALVEVVPLTLLADVKPLLVQVNKVEEIVELACTAGGVPHPPQRPL